MQNIMKQPHLRTKLYDALRKDCERVNLMFVKSEYWGFEAFGWLTRYFGSTLAFHWVSTDEGGILEKIAHFDEVIRLILLTAKDTWLFRLKEGENRNSREVLKRRLGGFYMTYLLHKCQPKSAINRLKIELDTADLVELRDFDRRLDACHILQDPVAEGADFFQSCRIILQEMKWNAIKATNLPVPHLLFHDIQNYRAHGSGYMPHTSVTDLVHLLVPYYKHHKHFLEIPENPNTIMHDSQIKLGVVPYQKSFFSIADPILAKWKSAHANKEGIHLENETILKDSIKVLSEAVSKVFSAPIDVATKATEEMLKILESEKDASHMDISILD